MIGITNIWYIDCMYVANYVMETEEKLDAVFISIVLSDWQFNQSDSMLGTKTI